MTATSSAYGPPPHDSPSVHTDTISTSASSASNSEPMTRSNSNTLPVQRPELGTRQSSGSMIIPRESKAELDEGDVTYPATDVRCMSPRRSLEDIEKLSHDARSKLQKQAQQLQESLMAIVDRIETVKSEHEKLEGGNKFLQSYIGELIQTSKITSTGSGRTRS